MLNIITIIKDKFLDIKNLRDYISAVGHLTKTKGE